MQHSTLKNESISIERSGSSFSIYNKKNEERSEGNSIHKSVLFNQKYICICYAGIENRMTNVNSLKTFTTYLKENASYKNMKNLTQLMKSYISCNKFPNIACKNFISQ